MSFDIYRGLLTLKIEEVIGKGVKSFRWRISVYWFNVFYFYEISNANLNEYTVYFRFAEKGDKKYHGTNKNGF